MGVTINNLCSSCTNVGCEFQSGIVKTECAFYMPPYIGTDNCGNYVAMQPTVEVTLKDQYEARLKADLEDILNKIRTEIEQLASRYTISRERGGAGQVEWADRLIREADILQILDKYKAETEK